jgi:hypothetical protein
MGSAYLETRRADLDEQEAAAKILQEKADAAAEEICDQHQSAPVDLSRVDSEIVVKMRMTGHTQSEIEQILVQCAQAVREAAEDRGWQQYAGRVARFAFGAGGDQRVMARPRAIAGERDISQ